MKCPFCVSELKQVKSKSAIVDICPKCKGIWFDSGEIVDFIRSLTESQELSPQTPELFKPREVEAPGSIEQEHKICPRCDKTLRTFNYAYDSNVLLDKCPDCSGIWADSGEIQQIASYLKKDPAITAFGKSVIKDSETVRQLQQLDQLSEELWQSTGPYLFVAPTIPVSDEAPRSRRPLITISIIVFCTSIFAVQLLLVNDPSAFFESYGFIPENFWHMSIISHMFLHAGIIHLIANMLFLWVFGDNVEDRFTTLGFGVLYLGSGIFASILHTLVNWGSPVPVIGASGAVSGIMGAYLVFYPRARVKVFLAYRILRVPAWLYLGSWFCLQLMYGLAYPTVDYSNIAWFAHIGGFVFGVVVAYFKKSAIQPKE